MPKDIYLSKLTHLSGLIYDIENSQWFDKKFGEIYQKEVFEGRGVEKTFQEIVEYILDLTEEWLIDHGVKPNTSKSMIWDMSKKYIDEKLAVRLIEFVGFRNEIVHEYDKGMQKKLFNTSFKDIVDTTKDFIIQFKKHI